MGAGLSIQTGLLSNPLEFEGVNLWIIERLPKSQEFDSISLPARIHDRSHDTKIIIVSERSKPGGFFCFFMAYALRAGTCGGQTSPLPRRGFRGGVT